jgi:hypothetical protein
MLLSDKVAMCRERDDLMGDMKWPGTPNGKVLADLDAGEGGSDVGRAVSSVVTRLDEETEPTATAGRPATERDTGSGDLSATLHKPEASCTLIGGTRC